MPAPGDNPEPGTPLAPPSAEEAMRCLEAFVIDNDDLVALEERIGRFNIFDALGIVRAEIRHSNFLAWLLDPGESHGTGHAFLGAALMNMLHRADPGTRPISPVELDGRDLGRVEVRRESDNIDILVAAADPPIVVAIENKIDSGEHSGQLARYRETVARRFPGHAPLFVYLTREGDAPSDPAWTPYSYADLHATLSRVRRLHAGAMGDDVGAFLDHYLRMIGSRFMDDPKIDELCDRIYRNHRQALDLIFDRRADPETQLIEAMADVLREYEPDLHTIRGGKSRWLIPERWRSALPPIGTDYTPGATWIFLEIQAISRRLHFRVVLGNTEPQSARDAVVHAIGAQPEKHPLRPRRALDNLTGKLTRLASVRLLGTSRERAASDEEIAQAAKTLRTWLERHHAEVDGFVMAQASAWKG